MKNKTVGRVRLHGVLGALLMGCATGAPAAAPDVAVDAASGRFQGVLATADGAGARPAFARVGAGQGATTSYPVASVTKAFTAVAVLRLVEDGRLSLDQPLETVWPGARGKPAGKATIEQLLRHTAGVASVMQQGHGIDDAFDPAGFAAAGTLDSEIARFIDRPLRFEPGARYEYSNSGYLLLGKVLEAVTGARFDEAILGLALAPAGLDRDACFCDGIVGHPDAKPREWRAPGQAAEALRMDPQRAASAGGLRITAQALLGWAQRLAAGRILRPDTLDRMWAPGVPTRETGVTQGLGWKVREGEGGSRVWVDGALPGVTAAVAIERGTGQTAIGVLTPTLPLDALERSERYLRERVIGLLDGTGRSPLPARGAAPAELAGRYRFGDGRVLVVTHNAGRWQVLTPGAGESPLTMQRQVALDDAASGQAVADVRRWLDGGQQALATRFSAELARNLPDGALDGFLADVRGRRGRAVGVHAWGLGQGGRVNQLRITFERGSVDLALVRDTAGLIDGLQLLGEDDGDAPAQLEAIPVAGRRLWVDGYFHGRDAAELEWIVDGGRVVALQVGDAPAGRAERTGL